VLAPSARAACTNSRDFSSITLLRVTRASVGANAWVFDKPFFLILNVAVGGDWPGYPDGSTPFPQQMKVDWIRVLDNVMLGLRDSEARSRALKLLADVGLAGREAAWPETLSGGEKQRVALARALAHEPELLLVDEPFGALDALTRLRMHALLFQLIGRYRPTVLLVTHDVDEALTLADRVLVMEEGRIALDRPVDLPHPRRPSDARYETLRRSLLAALGVFA